MDQIIVPANLFQQMRNFVSMLAPEEACGFIAGKDDTASLVLPVANQLHSPVRFLMDAHEQLEALEEIDRLSLQLLAIYHSHPNGPDHPSNTDITEAHDPNLIHLIWVRKDDLWQVSAYQIDPLNYQMVELLVIPG